MGVWGGCVREAGVGAGRMEGLESWREDRD